MTPQEFFKNDIFAKNAGIILLEVRKGYSKAKLEIKAEHLNAGATHKEEPSLRWQTLRLPQLLTRTAH